MHRLLHQHQADPNLADTEGVTALILAAGTGGGNHAVVMTLLGAGAEVDAEDMSGCTELGHGARAGSISVVEALLAAGVMRRDSALQMAEARNHPAVAALLRGEAASPAAQEPLDVVGIEEKLGMSLDELASLDRRGASGEPLMQKLRATHAALAPEDKLCMTLDDIIVQTRQAAARGQRHPASPHSTARRRSQRAVNNVNQQPITYLRRICFPGPRVID